MNKKRSVVLLLALSLFLPAFSCAETVILKSGRTIEGKIIEKTDKFIKIDFEGIPLTYYYDEIDEIETSTDVGIKINKPNGWYQLTQEELSRFSQDGKGKVTQTENGKIIYEGTGLLKILCFFSKYPFGADVQTNPSIAVAMEDLSHKEINSPIDYAKVDFDSFKIIYVDANLLEDIKEIELNGMEGAKCICVFTNSKGIKSRKESYVFLNNRNIKTGISLTALDAYDNFEENRSVFEKSINSFVIE